MHVLINTLQKKNNPPIFSWLRYRICYAFKCRTPRVETIAKARKREPADGPAHQRFSAWTSDRHASGASGNHARSPRARGDIFCASSATSNRRSRRLRRPRSVRGPRPSRRRRRRARLGRQKRKTNDTTMTTLGRCDQSVRRASCVWLVLRCTVSTRRFPPRNKRRAQPSRPFTRST